MKRLSPPSNAAGATDVTDAKLVAMPSGEQASDQHRDDSRRRRYEKVRQVVDQDALHDLVARHGPAILDREFPYLVVAARNQLRSRLRRLRRELSTAHDDDQIADEADPLAVTLSHATFRTLLEALARLDDRDVLVLWRQAEGVQDQEVAAEWDARGFLPANPTGDALRKRRERARHRLRQILGSAFLDERDS
jgi:hypothetical protein